jgi:hypothetical protein
MNKDINRRLVSLSVYLLGDNLLPETITEILKICPSDSRKKGEIIKSSTSGAEGVAKVGCWVLRARYRAVSENLADQIHFIVDSLGDKVNKLEEIEGIDKAFIDIYISPEENGGAWFTFDFSAEELKFLSSLRLPLQVTIDCCPVQTSNK